LCEEVKRPKGGEKRGESKKKMWTRTNRWYGKKLERPTVGWGGTIKVGVSGPPGKRLESGKL